jgi:hypothetical protein
MDFPPELKQALEQHGAGHAAASMPAEQWSSCFRNALVHGGRGLSG